MNSSTLNLVSPYGGTLTDLMVHGKEKADLTTSAAALESITLDERRLCDLELLATGAFSPLTGFMNEADYRSVIESMRLGDGTLFPIPITLPSHRKFPVGKDIALLDSYGNILATLTIEDVYEWDKDEYGGAVLGTTDTAHPLIAELPSWGKYNLSGRLRVAELPRHHDFQALRRTPAQVRVELEAIGNPKVVAFQTRNPLHRAHEEMTKRAARSIGGTLLLHPVVGLTRPGDVDYMTRVRCYKELVKHHYDETPTVLSLLPLAMRMAGPREALWHAIIRRNYGASHFIVGRDHAGPGKDSQGKPFYDVLEARDLAKTHEDELGIQILPFELVVYLPDEDRYEEITSIKPGQATATISGTQVREDYLAKGRPLPLWFTRPRVAAILEESQPPRTKQGFCLWFTGMSGAGKSTIAQSLRYALQERGKRVSLLDGDIVRRNLSQGLGFSKEDRDTNVRRIGFVASQIVEHNGVVLCAAISPYAETRQAVRALFRAPQFIEAYVATPVDVCRLRDPKGLYSQADAGKLKNFTGVDDAYEPPLNPELVIDTIKLSLEDEVELVLEKLKTLGFLQD